jgi:hypothetical protein
MINLENLEGNFVYKIFCGMTNENGTCVNEAIGEVSLEENEDGIPICEEHLEMFKSQVVGEET